MTDRIKHFLVLAAFVLSFQAVGGLLGTMTSVEMEAWYVPLIKSPLNPPGYIFGIAWTILYACLAISLWKVWEAPQSTLRKNALLLFGLHMVLNWAWTPVFFSAHAVFPALILLLVILVTAVLLCKMIWNLNRQAAFLLIPYIGWLCLALHLNFYIWRHN